MVYKTKNTSGVKNLKGGWEAEKASDSTSLWQKLKLKVYSACACACVCVCVCVRACVWYVPVSIKLIDPIDKQSVRQNFKCPWSIFYYATIKTKKDSSSVRFFFHWYYHYFLNQWTFLKLCNPLPPPNSFLHCLCNISTTREPYITHWPIPPPTYP